MKKLMVFALSVVVITMITGSAFCADQTSGTGTDPKAGCNKAAGTCPMKSQAKNASCTKAQQCDKAASCPKSGDKTCTAADKAACAKGDGKTCNAGDKAACAKAEEKACTAAKENGPKQDAQAQQAPPAEQPAK